MAFTSTARKHKHVQRFSEAELKVLDYEVTRLRCLPGLGTMTRTKIIRVALDVYFEKSQASNNHRYPGFKIAVSPTQAKRGATP